MSPVTIIEGNRTGRDPALDGRPSERRFTDLAAAVREHEAAVSGREVVARPQDLSLYRRLRQICGKGADVQRP
jgi:hypothetical protein